MEYLDGIPKNELFFIKSALNDATFEIKDVFVASN